VVKADAAGVGAAVTDQHTGRCLCGAVTYRARGLADIWYCHCRQCRALSGHYLAACRTRTEQIEIEGEVVWAPHSGSSDHGRCAACGSLLFWATRGSGHISVLPGSLDSAEGIVERGHIYLAEKGSYYAITDGLPQYDRYPEEGLSQA
jgi:hypothetical protein